MIVQTALQAAGFACVTVAAVLAARALLARGPAEPVLHWTRAGFLLLAGALVTGAWRTLELAGPQRWGLLTWLIFFAVLHVHRVPAFKGRPALAAGLAGWALAAAAWFWR
jgi:hypothetical protein